MYGKFTPPEDYEPKRAVKLIYSGVEVCILVECVNVYEGNKGYVFLVDWDNYKVAKETKGMHDIPGIPETYKEQYVLTDRLPCFLYYRFIPIDRPDWKYHYGRVGLDHQDQWELMVRMQGRCVECKFLVERTEVPEY